MKLPDITREDIIRQAKYIKDIAEQIIDLYSSEQDNTQTYARNRCSGGFLALDVTVLSIYITAYEYKNEAKG